MKGKVIGYWAATGLLAFAFAAGGLSDLARSQGVMEGMAHLGYPAYFAVILGVWKLLAAPALLVPGFPRLKEWAYAGIFFDLTGAAASHAALGDGAGKVLTPLFLIGIAAASWALRPEGRLLRAPEKSRDGALQRPASAAA